MTKRFFLFRSKFWLTILKILGLIFVAFMVLVQIPEILYDFGPKEPVALSGLGDLSPGKFSSSTFVSLEGTADFDRAFIYRRYGMDYTYFTIEPYGIQVIARTYEKTDDEWKKISHFLGKLRPFRRQPFSYRIRQIYEERFKLEIPQEAYFLALYDVPKPSGWQIGAMVFSSILWVALFYMFFFFDWKSHSPARSFQEDEEHPAGYPPQD
jgi:hypothetical protein